MSASDKKKLRATERAEKLNEKQQAEKKEAKKLKIMTSAFVIALALMLVFAIFTGVTKTVEGKGIREKNTVALTIGEHKISNAEMSYYFVDSVNTFLNNYGSYAILFGLDTTKPLNEQIIDEATGKTWADDFMDSAAESAKALYTIYDAAKEAGYELTDAQSTEIENTLLNMQFSALYTYGYSNLEDYLKAMYGYGATEESFRRYIEMSYIADAYQTDFYNGITVTETEISDEDAKNPNAYNAYSYNTYYLNGSNFDGIAAAEEAAKTLTAEEINTVEALDAAIAALPVNAESSTAASNASTDVSYANVSTTYAEWVTDSSRKAGDVAYFPYNYTTTDENGNETTEVRGYYVVMFNSVNDNMQGMSNVRHILVAFEGGSYDSTTGVTTYTDEEKLTAKLAAEEIYNEWKNGKANEASFAVLADEKSDDGDGTTGGLYEGINPTTNFVTNFKNWALAEHQIGDTEIIETEYGYHIMFFSGWTEQSYRNYMIENDLRSAKMNDWYYGLIDSVEAVLGDTKYIRTDLILSSN